MNDLPVTRFCPATALRAVMVLTALVPCAALAEADFSKGYDAGFQQVAEPVNARLVGTGSAGTAAPGGGFLFYNPAQPFLLRKNCVAVEHGRLHGDYYKSLIEASLLRKSWFVAAAVRSNSITGIVPADHRGPNYATPFSSQFTMAAIDVGYFTDRFSLALCLNGLQDRIETSYGYGVSVSVGAAYWAIPGHLSVGAAGFHLGTTRGMLNETDSWGKGPNLPKLARAGASWADSLGGVAYRANLDIVFDNARADGAVRRLLAPVGLEVWPIRFLALRAGSQLNHDTEILSFGFGVNLAPLQCDASFVVPKLGDDTEVKWLVGLSYSMAAF